MQAKSLRVLLLGAAAFSVAAFAPSQAHAQFQVQANYNLDWEQIGFGAGYNFGLGSLTEKNGISAVATFDFYLPSNSVTYMEANVNGKMDIKSVMGLYVGAGVGFSRASYDNDYCDLFPGADCDTSSSDFHLNVLGGYNFGSANKGPFAEAGLGIGSGSSLRLGGGFRF